VEHTLEAQNRSALEVYNPNNPWIRQMMFQTNQNKYSIKEEVKPVGGRDLTSDKSIGNTETLLMIEWHPNNQWIRQMIFPTNQNKYFIEDVVKPVGGQDLTSDKSVGNTSEFGIGLNDRSQTETLLMIEWTPNWTQNQSEQQSEHLVQTVQTVSKQALDSDDKQMNQMIIDSKDNKSVEVLRIQTTDTSDVESKPLNYLTQEYQTLDKEVQTSQVVNTNQTPDKKLHGKWCRLKKWFKSKFKSKSKSKSKPKTICIEVMDF